MLIWELEGRKKEKGRDFFQLKLVRVWLKETNNFLKPKLHIRRFVLSIHLHSWFWYCGACWYSDRGRCRFVEEVKGVALSLSG